jgi:hypothetical protein
LVFSTVEKSAMKKATYCWMAVALTGGILVSAAPAALKGRAWRAFWKLSPVIDCPAKLDLGEHEKGEIVVAPFTIANRGGGELLINEITSNCGCTGMEREENGGYKRLQSLRLKSGEEAHLVMRVSVGGVPLGSTMDNLVEFHTNDPEKPTARIEVLVTRVTGGVLTSPESVVFGTVAVGSKVQQTIDILDPNPTPRTITRVTSTGSDQICVKLLPPSGPPKQTETKPNGTLVGRLEVSLEANRPSSINATLLIEVAGREGKPDSLPVVGTVAALFEISPSLIVLPRSSNNGPIYSATCVCRGIAGKPITLTVDSSPKEVTAKVLPESASGERTVEIAWDPKLGGGNMHGQRQIIRFRAKDGVNEAVLDLPIILRK